MALQDTQNDPFPPAEFDRWAGQYDQEVQREDFPFTGYGAALEHVVQWAGLSAGQRVLDLGVGTGQLAGRFAQRGCEVWGSDFSEAMLAIARQKLPTARLFLHDLRQPLPPELEQPFDAVVSAYVFHHFELPFKVALAERLTRRNVAAGGSLWIVDLSFLTRAVLDETRRAAGAGWDEEPYWVVDEALPALRARGLAAQYEQISPCAGIYRLTLPA